MRQQQQLLLPWQMAVFCLALRRRTLVAPHLLGEPSPPSCTTVLLLCFIDSSLFRMLVTSSGVSAGSLAPTSQHVTPLTLLGSSAGASDGLVSAAC